MNKNKKDNINLIFKLVKPYKGWFVLSIILSAVLALLNLVRTSCIKKLVDNLNNFSFETAGVPMIEITIIIIISMFLIYGANYFSSKLGLNIIRDIKTNLFRNISDSDLEYINGINNGEMISKLNNEMGEIQKFFQNVLTNILFQPFMFLISSIYMIWIDWRLYLICYAFLPGIIFIINKINKKSVYYSKKYYESLGEANGLIKETIDGVTTIKVNNVSDSIILKCKNVFSGVIINVIKSEKYDSYQLPFYFLLYELPRITCLLFGGIAVINGNMTLGELIAYGQLIILVEDPINQISNAYGKIRKFFVTLERIEEIEDITYSKEASVNSDGRKLKSTRNSIIEFEHVKFSYDNKVIFNDLNFCINEGEKVAIVGQSGQGKSTLLNLISRIYRPTDGKIYISGYNYVYLNEEYLRKSMSYVLQNYFLYPISILENIKLANEACKKEKINESIKITHCDEFVNKLENGIDSIVSENGKNLSGGQRQRISLARAIVQNAPILLMDEPTAALDELIGRNVINDIFKIYDKKTLVIATHRYSFIEKMDKIIVISDGVVKEIGSHDELINQNGFYKELYYKQMNNKEGDIDEV